MTKEDDVQLDEGQIEHVQCEGFRKYCKRQRKWRKTNHDPSTTGDVMVQEEDCHALLVKVNAKGFTRVFAIVNLFALTCTNTNPRVKYMRRDFTEAFLPSILRQSCPPLLETFHFISTN